MSGWGIWADRSAGTYTTQVIRQHDWREMNMTQTPLASLTSPHEYIPEEFKRYGRPCRQIALPQMHRSRLKCTLWARLGNLRYRRKNRHGSRLPCSTKS